MSIEDELHNYRVSVIVNSTYADALSNLAYRNFHRQLPDDMWIDVHTADTFLIDKKMGDRFEVVIHAIGSADLPIPNMLIAAVRSLLPKGARMSKSLYRVEESSYHEPSHGAPYIKHVIVDPSEKGANYVQKSLDAPEFFECAGVTAGLCVLKYSALPDWAIDVVPSRLVAKYLTGGVFDTAESSDEMWDFYVEEKDIINKVLKGVGKRLNKLTKSDDLISLLDVVGKKGIKETNVEDEEDDDIRELMEKLQIISIEQRMPGVFSIKYRQPDEDDDDESDS